MLSTAWQGVSEQIIRVASISCIANLANGFGIGAESPAGSGEYYYSCTCGEKSHLHPLGRPVLSSDFIESLDKVGLVEVAQVERPNPLVVSPSNHEWVKLFVGIWNERCFWSKAGRWLG